MWVGPEVGVRLGQTLCGWVRDWCEAGYVKGTVWVGPEVGVRRG